MEDFVRFVRGRVLRHEPIEPRVRATQHVTNVACSQHDSFRLPGSSGGVNDRNNIRIFVKFRRRGFLSLAGKNAIEQRNVWRGSPVVLDFSGTRGGGTKDSRGR